MTNSGKIDLRIELRVAGATDALLALDWPSLDALASGAALVDDPSRISAKVRGAGIRLSALLARVDVGGATHVEVHGSGGYRACLPLAQLGDAVLAHRLDGAPLPTELGGPLRLLVPSADNACLSVKAVHRLTLGAATVDTVPRPLTPIRR